MHLSGMGTSYKSQYTDFWDHDPHLSLLFFFFNDKNIKINN